MIEENIFQVGELYYSLLDDGNVEVVRHKSYESLSHLNVPAQVTYKGESYKVTQIGYEVCVYCNFFDITLAEGITTLADNSFSVCSGNFSLVLPKSTTTLGENTFYNCEGLQSIVLSPNIKIIPPNCFLECEFKRMYIPEGVTIIGGGAFDCCDNMEIITFPSTLEYIGSQAFTNCSIRSIISYAPKPPEMGLDDPFQYKQKDSFLFVPEQSVSLYQHDPGWRWYQFNVRPITEEVEKLLLK